ncbi:ABC transporter permease [Marivita hallyeonensis]|uniref:Phospholipid/cholesterol/gamma-HCH transport system permease protein n=1 Tax=Marivita hallyeonensis TaxID=996342 RepID=A0A1M5MN13_9RHOB|nr:MlaE family lipid ABC transporter permease subunit [Marivita hallyeonensis]SHG78698.1 phospholipid/cholesterol/gamma-HCH transport system permease protein [Marivita hallyeonensis]
MSQDLRHQLVHFDETDEGVLRLRGQLSIYTVSSAQERVARLDTQKDLTIDIGDLSRIDTAGAWLLCEIEAAGEAAGNRVTLQNVTGETATLLSSVKSAMPEKQVAVKTETGFAVLLHRLGEKVSAGTTFLLELTGYLGLFFVSLGRVIRHPSEFRFTSLVAHAEDVGYRAVPIVSLMAFLIGVVLAFQGSAQLRQFGAEVFVVDLIAISILRELGILLTAIIVAGRTASAFTAAIGSMKMREEIDAMRTLGLDPAVVLFLPRILALLFMLPILGLIANIMGLFGGALMAWIELGISPSMFRIRLIEGTDVSHVFVGLIKAPVFALIIGVVGCHAGMQVKSNAESLGRMTSNAVVTAIFTVIVADALFSIFFAQVGL